MSERTQQTASANNEILKRSVESGNVGQHSDALYDSNRVLKTDPFNAMAYSVRGVANFKLGLYDSALEDFQTALFIDPGLAHAYCGRGAVRGKQKQFLAAIYDFTMSLKLDDTYATAYANRAAALTILEKNKLALVDFTRALRYEPNAKTLIGRARVFVKLDLLDAAIDDCLTAIEVDKEYADAYFLLFDLCIEDKNYDQAIEHMTRLLDLHPSMARAYYLRAYAYDKCGSEKSALKDLAEAARLDTEFQSAFEEALNQRQDRQPEPASEQLSVFDPAIHSGRSISLQSIMPKPAPVLVPASSSFANLR